jgi:DNA polymerase-3 subunit gamma/tau
MELYRKYRPKTVQAMIGQPNAVKTLTTMFKTKKIPHAIIFTGPSGTGKTTAARAVAAELNCHETDFVEINAADSRGVDMVRDIRSKMGMAGMSGCRVYLIDEAHALTKDAQSALLKMLEDTPGHVYFMLATTDPKKMLNTILTRCTEIRMNSVKDEDLEKLLGKVATKEGITLQEDVALQIIQSSDGSPRKALVLLNQIMGLDSTEEQLQAILSADSKKQVFDLFSALVYKKSGWPEIADILKSIDEEPETVRRIILAIATTTLIGKEGKAPNPKFLSKASAVANSFRDNFYDSGKAGLVLACLEASQCRT